MTKLQIFDDIVSVVKTDAAFCNDVSGGNSEAYRAKISDDMGDEEFLYLVQSYLATFQVAGHLSFRRVTRGKLPFTVKRYQDELYVVRTALHSPLSIGDKIIGVNGLSVKEYGKQHEVMLHGEPESRQGFFWYTLLSYATTLTVVHDGHTVTIPVELNGEWQEEESYFCRQLNQHTAYLRLKDFADDIAISRVYQNNDALLRDCEYLIIDVRGNGGGNDSAYVPLFQYCLPEGKTSASLQSGIFDSGIEINYTKRNCSHRLRQFEDTLQQDIPEETRKLLQQFVDEMKANCGKGFLPFGSGDSSEEMPYVGIKTPRKVYVITDEECASSGDAFVNDIRKCEKVTVIGRPTMGILDYSNCSGEWYDDYVLVYPTSRSLYLDKGIQMRGHGVPVDIHIPWTPAHCHCDVDLNTVLDLIEKEH